MGWRPVAAFAALLFTAGLLRLLGSDDDNRLDDVADMCQILSLPLAVLAAVLAFTGPRRVDSDLTIEGVRRLGDDLAEQVRAAEQGRRVKLLGGDVRPADVDYLREPSLVRYREAGGHEAGDLATVGDYYASLQPSRLLILGPAGSGKTVLAMELLVRLLRSRDPGGPVPVWFSLASWNPDEPLEDWLAGELSDAFGLRPEMATALVVRRQILPVLDGLDEMDSDVPRDEGAQKQAWSYAALSQLSSYVDGADPAPLVLTCREDRYAELTRSGMGLRDATRVYVQPLTLGQIIDYVRSRTQDVHDEDRWSPLLHELTANPSGLLAAKLGSPWRLTLALTVLRGPSPPDLPGAASVGELDAVLLGAFVPAVVSLDKAREAYAPERVEVWLGTIARHLNEEATAGGSQLELPLHEMWKAAGSRRVRFLHAALVGSCSLAKVFPLAVLRYERGEGFWAGILAAALLVACSGAAEYWVMRPVLLRPLGVDLRRARQRQSVLGAVAAAIAFALITAVTVGYFSPRPAAWLLCGIWIGVCTFLGVLALSVIGVDTAPKVVTPEAPFRADVLASLALPVMMWSLACVTLVSVSIATGVPVLDNKDQAIALLGFAFFTFVIFQQLSVRHGVAVAVLAVSGKLPWRPARFLRWAYEVGLLRTAGTAYQFRHLELQRWLAGDGLPSATAPSGSVTGRDSRV